MALRTPSPASPASPAASRPPGHRAGPPPRGRLARRLSASTTPTRLRLLMVTLLLASLAWGALSAWTVIQHASAAQDVVSTSEPLSLSAQQMYRSLADADVTATSAFLSGQNESLQDRQRYTADITQAATDLSNLQGGAALGSNPQLLASLSAISTALPAYTQYVDRAQTENSVGYLVTGGSFMQVASEVMHLTLLPAARTVYAQENAGLTAASARATGLPWIAVAVVFAIGLAFVLYRVQRWLWRHSHRRVNLGLAGATLVLVVGALWLIVAFTVARTDLHQGVGHGSAPAETLAQADIDTQQIRGDEILNLISRSGNTSFLQDYHSVRSQLGPGSGTLLTDAAASSPSGAGTRWAQAAEHDIQPWYAVNDQVYRLDSELRVPQERQLVTGTGPGSSAAGFTRVENDLSRAIAADQVIFHSNAAAGENAFTGLEAGIIVAALLMALGCVWGLDVRLAEYR
jgi:type II secretory pathway pseudopilin PulG